MECLGLTGLGGFKDLGFNRVSLNMFVAPVILFIMLVFVFLCVVFGLSLSLSCCLLGLSRARSYVLRACGVKALCGFRVRVEGKAIFCPFSPFRSNPGLLAGRSAQRHRAADIRRLTENSRVCLI